MAMYARMPQAQRTTTAQANAQQLARQRQRRAAAKAAKVAAACQQRTANKHYRNTRLAPDMQATRADFAAAARLKAQWFTRHNGLTWSGQGAVMAGSYVTPGQVSFTGAVVHRAGWPSQYEFSLPADSRYLTAWLYVDARHGMPTDKPGLYRTGHPLNMGTAATNAYIAAYTAGNTRRYRQRVLKAARVAAASS